MSDANSNWEKIVSRIHGEEVPEDSLYRGNNPEEDPDYKDAQKIKYRLKRVFKFDQFDKQSARIRLDRQLSQANHQKSVINLKQIFARVAVVLVAILSGYLLHQSITTHFSKALFSEVVVPLGQMTQINLSDGTIVWLNSGTTLKYPTAFDQENREVSIDGEGFFEVTHNSKMPFVVHTNNLSVKVLGTTFNVASYSADKKTDITLVKGSVVLQSNANTWAKKMVPGEAATIDSIGNVPKIRSVNTDFYTSWKEGKVVFKMERLDVIASKLERWYNVEIRFRDKELRQLQFSGTFLKYKPIEQVFKSLSITNEEIRFISENKPDQKDIIYIVRKNNVKPN